MSGTRKQDERHLDFEAFPENIELARNIQERIGTNEALQAYRSGDFDRHRALQNAIAIERYIVELYNDVKYNAGASALGVCNSIAGEAFLISRACAPRYFREAEDVNPHTIDRDIITFVKKMGDSIAMNEVDLDLGSNRWTTSTDLLMDMLTSLNVVSTSVLIEADNENIALKVDMEYNVITGCTLIAAYTLILYQCIKNGSYRGQTLSDLKT